MSRGPPWIETVPLVGADGLLCARCLAILIPMSFKSSVPQNDVAGTENRPTLKCPSCAQTYRWLDPAIYADQ